ncbi:MAG: cytochrome-c peroxidase [Cyclobacteriaceae bacterium]|nr:cytochrome-c peroxidase [Cyclobacteriaceae bacterium]
MKKLITFGIVLPVFVALVTLSCSTDTHEDLPGVEIFQATPYNIPQARFFPKNLNIPSDNPMTLEGVELGRYLFYDGRLSGNSSNDMLMSCATCHIQEHGFEVGIDHPKFTGGRTFGLPTEDHPNGKPTPNFMLPLVNSVYNHNGFLWNGFVNEGNEQLGTATIPDKPEFNFKNIESLVWMSITSSHEMNSTIEKSVAAIQAVPMYKGKFKAAFGDEEINYDRISKAIAQFVRSIVAQNSKFHKYLRQEAELTSLEKRGHDLFFSEDADCFHCHGGSVLMTTNEYFNNAKDKKFDPADRDRHAISGDPMDIGAYRAPSLINIEKTAPYMHDGRFKTLDEVIDFYSEGLVYSDYVHPLMKNVRQQGVQLNDADKAALKAFLLTLTDHEMLKSPQYTCPDELKVWSGQ